MTMTADQDLKVAAEKCRQTPVAQPSDPAALHQLGLVAVERGQLPEAVELISRSLRIHGANIAAMTDLANVLGRLGRLDQAIGFHRAALAAAPREAKLHMNLGNSLYTAGALSESLDCLRRAVRLDPRSVAARGNLGRVHQARGELALAIASYEKAIELSPDSGEVFGNLGGCLLLAGRGDEAIKVLARGVKKHPRCAAGLSNLAAAYTHAGRSAEAVDAAWAALKIDPRSSDALNNLGNAFKAQGAYPQAIGCFLKARQLQPGCHLAYNNLGSTLSEMGRSAEAVQALAHARALCPGNPQIFSNYLLTLNYLPGISREANFAEHRRFDEIFAAPLTRIARSHRNIPDPERRLRVGYVSADFREHPAANFVEPLLAAHSAVKFEVICYANHRVNDGTTQRLRKHADHWRQVERLSDAELATQIRQDKIDILVDLSGHTSGNRLLVFARKPAPVQVSMIGYMQTTGLSAMDYRITDEILDPSGTSEAFSSENLVRLATGAATFRPPANCPEVNELPALQSGYVTFASFNNLAKVTAETLAVWVKILRELPGSKLVVVGRAARAVESTFLAAGIGPDRVECLERLSMTDYLALHQRVDIMLDTFPYNGGTTTLIAAWMGLPFITLAGTSSISRTGAGLLDGLGLTELSASDPAGYIRCALAASSDLPRLAGWRRILRERLRTVLGDGQAHVRELEATYRAIWRAWCAQAAARKLHLPTRPAGSADSTPGRRTPLVPVAAAPTTVPYC